MYDLIVLGGGPAGYLAAERASVGGMNVLLTEKNALGGVCLNEGCIPTKTLLYSAKVYNNAVNGERYGVYAPEVSFRFDKIIARSVTRNFYGSQPDAVQSSCDIHLIGKYNSAQINACGAFKP